MGTVYPGEDVAARYEKGRIAAQRKLDLDKKGLDTPDMVAHDNKDLVVESD